MQLVAAGPDSLPPVTITLGHANQSRVATTDGTGLAGTRRGATDWTNIGLRRSATGRSPSTRPEPT